MKRGIKMHKKVKDEITIMIKDEFQNHNIINENPSTFLSEVLSHKSKDFIEAQIQKAFMEEDAPRSFGKEYDEIFFRFYLYSEAHNEDSLEHSISFAICENLIDKFEKEYSYGKYI